MNQPATPIKPASGPVRPATRPTLADVLDAVARLEGKVDRLLQAQAAKPAASGYKTL